MARRPTLSTAALLAAVALLAAACALPAPPGGGRQGPDPGHLAAPPRRAGKPAATHPRRPPPARGGATVRVLMDDRFRYRPRAMMVPAGATVTFAVTNLGKLPHEFVLGDRATQLDHERRMQAGGTHAHDHGPAAGHAGSGGAGAVAVPPGQTRRLTWTFDEPGTVIYGCHVLGHWAAGMRGTILVVRPDRRSPRVALPPPRR